MPQHHPELVTRYTLSFFYFYSLEVSFFFFFFCLFFFLLLSFWLDRFLLAGVFVVFFFIHYYLTCIDSHFVVFSVSGFDRPVVPHSLHSIFLMFLFLCSFLLLGLPSVLRLRGSIKNLKFEV